MEESSLRYVYGSLEEPLPRKVYGSGISIKLVNEVGRAFTNVVYRRAISIYLVFPFRVEGGRAIISVCV